MSTKIRATTYYCDRCGRYFAYSLPEPDALPEVFGHTCAVDGSTWYALRYTEPGVRIAEKIMDLLIGRGLMSRPEGAEENDEIIALMAEIIDGT